MDWMFWVLEWGIGAKGIGDRVFIMQRGCLANESVDWISGIMCRVLGIGVLGCRELGIGYSQCNGVVLQTRWRQWIATVKACPWSSYGITQGSHGLRLLGINPSLNSIVLYCVGY